MNCPAALHPQGCWTLARWPFHLAAAGGCRRVASLIVVPSPSRIRQAVPASTTTLAQAPGVVDIAIAAPGTLPDRTVGFTLDPAAPATRHRLLGRESQWCSSCSSLGCRASMSAPL